MSTGLPYYVEACVISLEQAVAAQQKGADRVELCSRLETEGMTPDVALVTSLCEQLTISIRVMIRATEEGYAADEKIINEMISSIHDLKVLPVEGFVFGVLKNNRIDQDAMKRLLGEAFPKSVTFHKAIDLSENIPADLDWLNQHAQVDTVLSSGGAVKAIDGVEGILEMKSLFNGHVMGAGKITSDVLPTLHELLQLQWYHGRAIV